MYRPDDRDSVAELTGFPFPCVVEPEPQLVSDEYELVLAYRIDRPREWRMTSDGEQFAVVRFEEAHLHQFAWFTDEDFHRHPLYARGLHPYGGFEVRDSSWIRALREESGARPGHDPDGLFRMRHFVFVFTRRTLECVAPDCGFTVHPGPLSAVRDGMLRQLSRP